MFQPLQYGTDRFRRAESLRQFVADIAGVEVGENQYVGAARDLFGSFVPGFLIWAVPAWALVLTGLYLPKKMDLKQDA